MGVRRLLVSDLDGTLLGDDVALERFAAWHAARRDQIKLAYATGRSLEGIQALIRETALPHPDVSIVQVGTEIYDDQGRPWPGWDERFVGWNAEVARRVVRATKGVSLQPTTFQTARKASFYAPRFGADDVDQVGRLLARAGLPARIIYSGDLYLDVLPIEGGKGAAASAVARALEIEPADVLVFGDSGNDLDLFDHGFRGTVVANATRELARRTGAAYRSPYRHAEGVLDGIRHWWPDGLQPMVLEEAPDRVRDLHEPDLAEDQAIV